MLQKFCSLHKKKILLIVNNFARGHYTIGKEMVVVVAVGGGTRSGLGSLLLETEDERKITAEAKRAKRWIRRARIGPPKG